MLNIESPQTREQLIDAFDQQEIESVAYWDAFDTGTFFRKIGSSWSPADTVRHLTKSIRPVGKALATPKIFLRVMFGRPRRASMSYDELRATYQQALAAGGKAGRFAPSEQSQAELEPWRATIMANFR